MTTSTAVVAMASLKQDQADQPKRSVAAMKGATDPGSSQWRIIDDLPGTIPVTQAEIDVLEIFFADLLDEILGGKSERR